MCSWSRAPEASNMLDGHGHCHGCQSAASPLRSAHSSRRNLPTCCSSHSWSRTTVLSSAAGGNGAPGNHADGVLISAGDHYSNTVGSLCSLGQFRTCALAPAHHTCVAFISKSIWLCSLVDQRGRLARAYLSQQQTAAIKRAPGSWCWCWCWWSVAHVSVEEDGASGVNAAAATAISSGVGVDVGSWAAAAHQVWFCSGKVQSSSSPTCTLCLPPAQTPISVYLHILNML